MESSFRRARIEIKCGLVYAVRKYDGSREVSGFFFFALLIGTQEILRDDVTVTIWSSSTVLYCTYGKLLYFRWAGDACHDVNCFVVFC